MRPQRRICLILYLRKMLRNINRILLPDLNTQRKEHTQYITKIHVLGRTEIYLVVTEVNMPLTILDYMALENAVITLQYSFMETYARNEIEKKYQRDIEYSLLNGLLTGDELSKAARMLS